MQEPVIEAATGLGNRTLWYTAGRLSLPAPPRGRQYSNRGCAQRSASRKKDDNER
jgi:hypothetical protein